MRAVTFDAAGTLIAPAEPVGVTYARVAARHGIAADATEVERRFRAAFATAPPLAFGALPAPETAARERAWWRALVAAALDCAPDDACFDEVYAHYAAPRAWRVFGDVVPALTRLRARGVRCGVVSNFDARLPALLAGLDLAPLLDAVVHSTGAGSAKPAAAIFHAACTALDVSPAATLHVGDDLVADLGGALAAGLDAILLVRRGLPPALPPGARAIASLDALAAQP